MDDTYFETPHVKLILGDCRELIARVPSASVDLVYANPPFGITGNKWDTGLNWDADWWEQLFRVLKPAGTIVLHSSTPFTQKLCASQQKNYRYRWIWLKNRVTLFTHARKQPLRMSEEVCVFYRKLGTYNPQMAGNRVIAGQVKAKTHYYRIKNDLSKQRAHVGTFPIDVLCFPQRQHQFSTRTLDMCEYFVKTYTNEGDTVLDFSCSDAMTGRACTNLNRQFIGFDINRAHLDEAMINVDMGPINCNS